MTTPNIKLYNDNCLNAFKGLEDSSIDMVCVDPPYGTTGIEWDKIINFKEMWAELERIVKPNGNIIIFGSQPFTSLVICSKLDWFRYELIWNKNKCGSPGLSKYRPQKVHENIMVFNKNSGGTYNPIMETGPAYKREAKDKEKGYGSGRNTHEYGFGKKPNLGHENHGTRYPKSIVHASRNFSAQQTVHPTQKPTNLLNWLIMTYSNPGDTVMDFTMGSGGCGVAAKLTGRNFVGIDQSKEYFEICKTRIDAAEFGVVLPTERQLTTQLPEGYNVNTLPEKKYESGILEKIIDPTHETPTEKKKSKKTKPVDDTILFEFDNNSET